MILRKKNGYWNLKKEALDQTMWRTQFGRTCPKTDLLTNKWLNEEKLQIMDKLKINLPQVSFCF
jgi:hypothetical protein